MTIISRPLNLGVLGALLHFGEVPDFLRQLLTQKNLVHAFAGALGGITSLSVFFPLDTARTRLQGDAITNNLTIVNSGCKWLKGSFSEQYNTLSVTP